MTHKIHIKNMVCPRCITAVSSIFSSLNIKTKAVSLGEVICTTPITSIDHIKLKQVLLKEGFEFITDYDSKITTQIKALIVEKIQDSTTINRTNISSLLTTKLNKDYSTLSKLFSAREHQTIEKFYVNQKIERVKELLSYNELTVSEIAHQLHYSSTAHLSSQFKKVVGMNPTQYKKGTIKNRKPLDSI